MLTTLDQTSKALGLKVKFTIEFFDFPIEDILCVNQINTHASIIPSKPSFPPKESTTLAYFSSSWSDSRTVSWK